MVMHDLEATAPIVKSVTVPVPPTRAFDIFVRDMFSWWPVESHSIGEERVVGLRVEERPDGRVLEVLDDGTEYEWARVLVWEPPHRVVLEWHPNPERADSTEVEVRFSAAGSATRVDLEHRRWEALGDAAAAKRANYTVGWDPVLERFAEAAGAR